jgi:sialate O-acetylesterase
MLQGLKVCLAALALAMSLHAPARADGPPGPFLASVFSDHAVIQRDRKNPVWGRVAPKEKVVVTFAGATLETTADATGYWRATLPALPAGGPHTLSVTSLGQTQTVNDILAGDVWLCSGQSNMQWSVRVSTNGRAEAEASANDRIRSFSIERTISTTPLAEFPTKPQWLAASPENTPNFSAVCYFFVRELQKTVNVPQGMIVAAWGGSKIEPWMSEAGVKAGGSSDAALDIFSEYKRQPVAAAKRWGEYYQKWWLAEPLTAGSKPWSATDGDAASWRDTPAELKAWETWGVKELENYNGVVWYRKKITLTAAQARQSATLSLAQVDEVDLTFVNGIAIGSSSGGDRKYAIPPKLLKAGDNNIVVNALDTWAAGGMYGGNAPREIVFGDGSKLPLSGPWQYQKAPAGLGNGPRAPWESTAGLTTIYNAMIAPLGAYGLRGVAWYQGESNAYLAESAQYQHSLAALFADWRRQFAAPLPFLVVQLPNYGPTTSKPVESGWARLRESERRAVVADGNAALVVTIDIGDNNDIHPTNKLDVGRRMARAARNLVFKEALSAYGAEPLSARREGGSVAVTLGKFEGDLVVRSSKDPAAFELCGAAAGSCRFVSARLGSGGAIALDAGDVPDASRVRYCWADSPVCNLYDSAGQPVGPFEIDVR